MKTKLLLFLMLTIFSFSANAQWQQTNGPTGGQVSSLVVSGSNIFAATNFGVYKSSNNGTSWNAANTGIPANYGVNTLAVNGTNIYAGVINNVMYISANNGASWTGSDTSVVNIKLIAFMGTDIYAANENGLYKSTNNGTNWTLLNAFGGTDINCMAISNTNIFVGTSNKLYLSTDYGITWTALVNGLSSVYINAISIYNTDIIVGTNDGIFKSSDNGANWVQLNNGISNIEITAITTNGTNIFAGTWYDGMYLSTDNGASWTLANNGLPGISYNSIVITGANVFATTDGAGVFLSANNGASWSTVNNGLPVVAISSMVKSGPNIIAGTYGSGVFSSSDNGNTWNMLLNGIPELYTHALAANGSILLAGTHGSGIFKSTDNGASWTAASTGLQDFITYSIVFDGANIYAGGMKGVYISTDNAASWTLLPSLDTTQSFIQVEAIAVKGNKIFAGTDNGIYMSTNNGIHWTLANGNNLNQIHCIAICGSNILAGTEGEVYISANNGLNWTAMQNGIYSASSIKSIYVNGSDVFVGTQMSGSFLSTNNGLSWAQIDSIGFPFMYPEVTSFTSDSLYIYKGMANGVWRCNRSDLNLVTYNFSGNVFNDINNNGIKDNGEAGLANILIKTKADNWIFNTDSIGNYTAYSNFPTDSISLILPSLYSVSTPQHYAVTASDTGMNFALHYIPDVRDLRITVTHLTAARPGFNDVIYITYENVGTDTMSGNVTLGFPNNNISYLNSTPPQSNINGNLISWNFTNLLPLEQRDIAATFNILSTVTLGTILGFSGAVYPIVGDTTPFNNQDGIEQIVTNAIDPNEKEVIPSAGFTPQQLAGDQKLVYTIHFQNTGNDTAFSVIIIDTLSQNLDASTFELLSSSHPCTFAIRGAGIVEFMFANILLPDSNVNLIGSNGFVKYAVKPKTNLQLGDNITNTAFIYFDFNQPVETNTTNTLIYTGIADYIITENGLLVYPNPSHETLTIETLQQNSAIEILNIQGQLIKTLTSSGTKTNIDHVGWSSYVVDISALPCGVYIVEVRTEKGIAVKKFVKE